MTEKKNNIWKIAAIILLITNIVTLLLYFNQTREKIQVSEELVETQDARNELQSLLSETELTLNEYKGQNAELDSIITQKNTEIQGKAAEIEQLLAKGRITAAQLEKAKDELDVLRYYVNKYSRQIDSVSRVNARLMEENEQVKGDLKDEKRKTESLIMDKIKLENKVVTGAKLQAEELSIVGIQNRQSGRERETDRAGRIDQVSVKFKIAENFLADRGPKDIYLRIIGPDGATIAPETSGGGIFKFQGSDMEYSSRQRINFDNSRQVVSFRYAKSSPWAEGKYTFELYADGLLVEKREYVLK